MLTFVRLSVFAMFVISMMMSLVGAAMISLCMVVPNFSQHVSGDTEILLFAPAVAVALAVAFGYLESVARRWPDPPN